MPDDTPPAHRMPMAANPHSGTALAMIEATSPGRKPVACRAYAISFETCNHCRQLVGCQTPNFFSRIAGRSPRVCTASKKLFAIVSATVSTAGLAIACFLSWSVVPGARSFDAWSSHPILAPGLLLFPAPFAPRACFLCAQVELLDVPGMHQPLACVVHDDAADFQHIAIMRRLQRHLGVLLDQQDRHALLFVDATDDGENLPYQDRRQSQRRLIQQKKRGAVHQRPPDGEHLLFAARKLAGGLVEPLLKPRKIAIDPLQIVRDGVAVLARIGAHHQVFAYA